MRCSLGKVLHCHDTASLFAGGRAGGESRDKNILQQAGLDRARGILILTSDDLVNISTTLMIRSLQPDARVVVRLFNHNLMARLSHAVKNVFPLSVSGLTAPVLALTA